MARFRALLCLYREESIELQIHSASPISQNTNNTDYTITEKVNDATTIFHPYATVAIYHPLYDTPGFHSVGLYW